MNIREMIKELNRLTEESIEGVSEDVLNDVPAEEPEIEPKEVEDDKSITDNMTLADTLDAKTKIARALENLKVAVDEFKEASAEKVDLLKDELLLGCMVGLDDQIKAIEAALAAGSNILKDTELNDAFKTELPEEPVENDEEGETLDDETTLDNEESNEENSEEDLEELNFDDEAGLDLLNPEA